MYYIRHYTIYDLQSNALLTLLDNYNISFEMVPCIGGEDNIVVFDIPENMDRFHEIAPRLPLKTNEEISSECSSDIMSKEQVFIDYYPVYSEDERSKAQWLFMRSIPLKVVPEYTEAYWSYHCFFDTGKSNLPMGRHRIQTRPIEIRRPVKWGKNFFSCSLYDPHYLFCNTIAKRILLQSNITGIEFMPVLKKSSKEPIDDVYQLNSSFTIPDQGIVPVNGILTRRCEHCGVKMLYNENGKPEYAINEESIDARVDFLQTLPIFVGAVTNTPTAGYSQFVISQKMYSTLHKNGLDKNVECIPLKTVI